MSFEKLNLLREVSAMEFVTHSREETEALGGRLADALDGGAVVAFTGD